MLICVPVCHIVLMFQMAEISLSDKHGTETDLAISHLSRLLCMYNYLVSCSSGLCLIWFKLYFHFFIKMLFIHWLLYMSVLSHL